MPLHLAFLWIHRHITRIGKREETGGAIALVPIGSTNMTMLTHTGGYARPASHLSGGRDAPGTDSANAHMAMIKRFGMGALTTLILGGVLGGIVALKVAVFLSRSNY